MQSKPSKGCRGAEATVEGPFFAAREDCSSEEEMPALGGALPTPPSEESPEAICGQLRMS